jgi:hypothetical protein
VISFLSPLFLAGAAAAAIPVLLHLLKREPEARVRFSDVRLLRNAPVEHTSRRHLRELLLLALRVAALLLLAFAFARPFFAGTAAQASSGVTMIALDTSLSMTAPGRFERARQMALDAVNRAPRGEPIGVVTFGDTARVAAQPSTDRGAAAAAINAAQPGFGATRYRAGLNAAGDALNGRAGTIVVVTDLLENGWDAGDQAVVPEKTRIEIADVGPPPANLAVTAVRVEGDRVFASIRNSGAQPRSARARLFVGAGGENRPAGDTGTVVPPQQSVEVSFPAVQAPSASVEVDDPGGIAADNVRYVVLEHAGRPRVLIVGSTADVAHDAFYLQQALVAGGASAAYDAEGVGARELAGWDQARMNSHAAVVLTSTKGLERHGRDLVGEFVRSGGGLLVTAGADVDGAVVADTLAGLNVAIATPSASDRDMQVRSLAPADVRHPVFQRFGAGASSLGLVQFHRVASVRAPACSTLARFTTGETALADCVLGEGRVLVLASDLDNRWNDFPLHATFVPFVHEAVRYLAGSHLRSSEYLVDNVPSGVAPRPGIARAPANGGGSRLVAVNVDPAESGSARLTPEEFQTAVTRLKETTEATVRVEAREQENRQHIWQYVLALMMAMLVVESVVATRTA